MAELNAEQRMEETKRKAAEAVERCKLNEEWVATLEGEPATAGDVVLLSKDGATSVFFVLAQTHPDDENSWYAVPCDDAPFVGPADIGVFTHADDNAVMEFLTRHRHFVPMVIRVGIGVWLDSSVSWVRGWSERWPDLRLMWWWPWEGPGGYTVKRTGRLSAGTLSQVTEMLADIARCGGLPSTPEQKEVAWDPDYDEHMDRLRRDVAKFETDELGDADTDYNIEFEE